MVVVQWCEILEGIRTQGPTEAKFCVSPQRRAARRPVEGLFPSIRETGLARLRGECAKEASDGCGRGVGCRRRRDW